MGTFPRPLYYILLHVLVWVAVLFLPTILSFRSAVQFDRLLYSPNDVKNLMSWLLFIGFVYGNHLCLVPLYYVTQQRVKYFLLVLLGLILILILPEFVLGWDPALLGKPPLGPVGPGPQPGLEVGPGPEIQLDKPSGISELSHMVLFFAVSVLVSISYHTQLRLRDIEQAKLQAELHQLKSQIHPHFLFNTLNSIYALAVRKNDKTAEVVVQLSEFLRYVIRDADHEAVPLEKELDYIQNYLDLQRSRLRDSVDVQYQLSGNPEGLSIAPLILFSFVENAFKHGVNPDEESKIDLSVFIDDKHILLKTYNHKVNRTDAHSNGGIGVTNARKRLTLLYPDRHQLSIVDGEKDYAVDLRIQL